LWREIATVIGVTASARPAAKPPILPQRRRTRSYTSATLATPISACGISTLSGWYPNARTDSDCTQSASGGLSTVMTPP
jgi:energy-converting hydrogenase Eha subunit A